VTPTHPAANLRGRISCPDPPRFREIFPPSRVLSFSVPSSLRVVRTPLVLRPSTLHTYLCRANMAHKTVKVRFWPWLRAESPAGPTIVSSWALRDQNFLGSPLFGTWRCGARSMPLRCQILSSRGHDMQGVQFENGLKLLKTRPESALDWLMCSKFARQRLTTKPSADAGTARRGCGAGRSKTRQAAAR